ncbi:MAG: MFS transporter [Pseudomonadota bacterium]
MADLDGARSAPANTNTDSPSPKSVLRSKLFWVAVLYFAEGFPLGIFYEVLPVFFRVQDVELSDIGFLSLLGLAWSIKFLWAPAVDRYRHHRTWMLVVDFAMAAILLTLAVHAEFGTWIWFAIAIFTLLSATNDIAIDGYTVEMLDKHELGLANGVRIALYRGALISTGALLAMEKFIGWSGVFAGSALIMAGMGIWCRMAPPELPGGGRTGVSARDELTGVFRNPGVFMPGLFLLIALVAYVSRTPLQLLESDAANRAAGYMPIVALVLIGAAGVSAWLGRRATQATVATAKRGPVFGAFLDMATRPYFMAVVLFILTFKLADQTIGFMIKPFWVDAGFSTAQIGLVSVNIGILLSILGGIAGGWFTDRVGVFRGLWILGLTQIISNLGYVYIAYTFDLPGEVVEQPIRQQALMYTASGIESFTQGLGTGAFLAFLMAIVDKRNAATEFAVLSSIFAVARSVAGWAGGYGAQELGYADFFLITMAFGIPAYFLLPFVRAMLDFMSSNKADPPAASSAPS